LSVINIEIKLEGVEIAHLVQWIGNGLEQGEIVVRFYARERYVYRLHIAKTGSGAHPLDRYKKLFLPGANSLEN